MAITLNGTTGISTPDGSAGTPPYTGASGATNGLYFPTATSAAIATNGTNAVTIDSSQNVGVGATPQTWSTGKAVSVAYSGSNVWSATESGNIFILSNAYYNGGYKYDITGKAASYYQQNAGIHAWYNAPSGTAGAAITFTQAMTLDASGNLTVSNTASPVFTLSGSTSAFNNIVSGSYLSQIVQYATGESYWQSNGTVLNFGTTSNSPFTFKTNNTERMRVNAGAPILCLSGGNTTATGTGIAFPATQSASSDANTLDDYEEGTWTPQLQFGAASVGMTGTFNGRYTKVGNLVSLTGYIAVTNKGSSTGVARIFELPFTTATTGSNGFYPVYFYVQGGAITLSAGTLMELNTNSNVIDLNFYTTTTGVDGNLTNTSFNTTGGFWFSATYRTT